MTSKNVPKFPPFITYYFPYFNLNGAVHYFDLYKIYGWLNMHHKKITLIHIDGENSVDDTFEQRLYFHYQICEF